MEERERKLNYYNVLYYQRDEESISGDFIKFKKNFTDCVIKINDTLLPHRLLLFVLLIVIELNQNDLIYKKEKYIKIQFLLLTNCTFEALAKEKNKLSGN